MTYRSEIITLIVLGIALLMAIYLGMSELATNIASGLIGYIGGNTINHLKKGE